VRSKVTNYIRNWKNQGYLTDIPDSCPLVLEKTNCVPSYRKIALAILQNDHTFKTLGMSQPKSEVYNAIKKEELRLRALKNAGNLENPS